MDKACVTALIRATHRLVRKFIFNLFIVMQNYSCETRDVVQK